MSGFAGAMQRLLTSCMKAFAEPVTFIPQAGASFPIAAVFTERAKDQVLRDGFDAIEEKVKLGCQESQFNGQIPVQNDQFSIRGRLWRAAEVLPDGHGHIVVELTLADDSQANIIPVPAYG